MPDPSHLARRVPAPSVRLAALIGTFLAAVTPAAGAEPEKDAIPIDRLNAGLPRRDGLDLGTPQATLEHFIFSCEEGDYASAAHALDLNGIAPGRQAEEGASLARQLKEVMDRQVWFRWDEVPDRPDGQLDEASIKKQAEGREGPQSSLRLGTLYIGDVDYEVRLERVKPKDGPSAWVFSPQTVKHIPILHEEFGESWVEGYIPEVLKRTRFLKIRLWQWLGFAVLLATGTLLGWLTQKGLDLLNRPEWPWVRTVAEALEGPGSLALGLWTFYFLSRKILGLAGPIVSLIEPLYIAVLVASLIWFLQRLITYISARILNRYSGFNNDEANVLITRIEVVRHILTFAVLVAGTLFILTRFEWFRQVGVMMLASAGVAGLILGVAAQRVLGNVFAGILLALTQPVKSGDAIIFEEDFGWVEEITLTYLVIRTWDRRRLVVPIAHFLDKPIQNWSRRSQQLMLPLTIYADYRVDAQAVREEFERLMEASEEWDRSVPPIFQVTECKEGVVELRGLCSAADPTSSWNLRCRVREGLLAFLQDLEGGLYLPRRRIALVGDDRREPTHDANGHQHPEPAGLPDEAESGPGRAG
ncbi:Miniconductance mechanosensitive channel MscM precursor [Aquisphaera giovannonii]|uniref:Miniconductance mechanosensitive channel MscM n=1 Tax=Aquisphaera giovannonii TaxID=406548 RepID=A0A5B9VUR4_9BACT|nr:mechanosensitive ion channel family protein [Aquisphaera giovannonii]QEH31617.1 Miniconductance mechanosensitive channel MscM precursor [Aquisphaera giovannonii]